MDWTTFISGVGAATVFLVLGAYARIKQIQHKNETDKIELRQIAAAAAAEAERTVIENQALKNKQAEDRRKADQEYHYAQEQRISQQKDDLYESMKVRFLEFSNRLDAEIKELKLEGQRRELEHIKCKAENDLLRRDLSLLQTRMDALDKKGAL